MSVATWEAEYAAMSERWGLVSRAERLRDLTAVGSWHSTMAAMRSERDERVAEGHWRSGPRTLLAALGRQDRELALTAGFAWLLRPDGHHGLGSRVLGLVLDHVGLHEAPRRVRDVLREEERIVVGPRGEARPTRADLVVYAPTWTIVVEAKAFAIEQPDQLDRLFRGWGDEPDPRFVFLTRGVREEKTAVDSAGRWKHMTWRDVARIARMAVDESSAPAPGVRDYITTLEAYHRV